MSAIAIPFGTSCRIIQPNMRWVDLPQAKREIELPKRWKQFEAAGFHPDIIDRVYAHLAYAKANGGEDNARAVLGLLAEGFSQPFDRSRFEPAVGDPAYQLKRNSLDAFEELAAFYGDRISSVIWNSLAHLACRKDPEREQSILAEASTGSLPYNYTLVDSAIHAAGLVYTFLLHVNSVMFKHTGRVLVHNCDCNCKLTNLEEAGGRIEYELPRKSIVAASQSVFTHCLAETWKLMECFLPFAYSLSPEARAIQALL